MIAVGRSMQVRRPLPLGSLPPARRRAEGLPPACPLAALGRVHHRITNSRTHEELPSKSALRGSRHQGA